MSTTARFLRVVLVVWLCLWPNGAEADRIASIFPVCTTAKAVGPAFNAYFSGDVKAVIGLECLLEPPDGLRGRVRRCGADKEGNPVRDFGYPVLQDSTLPNFVCEVFVDYYGIWTGYMYTSPIGIRPE